MTSYSTLTCLLLSLPFILLAQKTKPAKFPLYQEVVQKVIQHVKVGLPASEVETYNTYLIFVLKKPQGYYLALKCHKAGVGFEELDVQPFWTPKKGYSKQLQQLGTGSIEATPALSKDPSFEQKQIHFAHEPAPEGAEDPYDLFPYFGYTNWHNDTYTYYQKHPAKTNEDLFALASAMHDRIPLITSDTISYASTAQALKACLKQWHELYLRAPNYRPFEWTVESTYADYTMQFAFYALMQGWTELHQEFMATPNLYSEAVLQFAKNYLASCPPNALLFCDHSYMYFPMLYLQQKEQLRIDVLLVCHTYLRIPAYQNYLRDPQQHGPQVALPFIAIPNTLDAPIPTDESSYCTPEQFVYTHNKKKQTCSQVSTMDYNNVGLSFTNLEDISSTNYQVITILLANKNKRPVLLTPHIHHKGKTIFTQQFDPSDFKLLGSLYELEEGPFVLDGQPIPLSQREIFINTALYLEHFEWAPLPHIAPIDKTSYLAWLDQLIVLYDQLNFLTHSSHQEQAHSFAQKIHQTYGPAMQHLSVQYWINYIDCFYTLGMRQEADALYGRLLEHLLQESQRVDPFSHNTYYTYKEHNLIDHYRQKANYKADSKNWSNTLKTLQEKHKIKLHQAAFEYYQQAH